MPRADLRSALRVSTLSALWTFGASTAAIGIGLSDGSLALVAFGAVGLFDCGADLVLIAHFRALRADARAEHLEAIALRVITAGLIAVGLATGGVSVFHLARHSTGGSSSANVVLAAVSLVGLAALALRKCHLAARLPSRALAADGRLSAVGAVLAGITLAGTLAASLFGWWWADPAAALAIAVGAIRLGVGIAREPQEPN